MKPYLVNLLPAALLLAGAAGCAVTSEEWNPEPVVAVYAADGVSVDGVLDDAVWETAPKYHFGRDFAWEGGPALQKAAIGPDLRESGYVQTAWDDEYLYIAFSCVDSDLEVLKPEDQKHLYLTGDLGEVFIKPAEDVYYWENYVAPTGNKTSLFFPSRGLQGLTDITDHHPMRDLKAAAAIRGTLNDWTDVDGGWTGEMAIPIAELEQYGASFTEDPWTIFFGRYNYSRYLPAPELSCYPVVPALSFHLTEYYPALILQK